MFTGQYIAVFNIVTNQMSIVRTNLHSGVGIRVGVHFSSGWFRLLN
jgi:hypothetical protein